MRDDAAAIHELFSSPYGRVISEGLGTPGLKDDLSDESIAGLAVGLLHRLTFEIHRHHRQLDRTTFDFVSKGVKEPIGFALIEREAD